MTERDSPYAPPPTGPRALGFIAGVLLAGYGLLVVTRLLAHERFTVGVGLLVAGAVIMGLARPREAAEAPPPPPGTPRVRAVIAAALGTASAGGVVAYNALARSILSPPEVAIVAYGILIVAATPFLHVQVRNTDVGTLVAWSLPLVAAPLGLWGLDALINAYQGTSPVNAVIEATLVAPLAWTLTVLGFDVTTTNQTLAMTTPRGQLVLGIGLVCAGLHPGILFLGVFGLYAWRERTPPPRLAALVALGLAGVYVANLLRLVVLAVVGHQWGGVALQTAHAHAGWMIFVGWMIAYWWLVLRRFHGTETPTAIA